MDHEPCQRLEFVETRLAKLEKAVEGNGKPGLKEEVIMIKETQKGQNRALRANNWMTGGILLAVAIEIFKGLFIH